MALDKPRHPYAILAVEVGVLRYAGTLSGLELDYYIAFAGQHADVVLGELRQLSYQGRFVHISYIPLFDDFADGSDYREATLAVDDLIWVFGAESLEEVIALRKDLKTNLSRTVSV